MAVKSDYGQYGAIREIEANCELKRLIIEKEMIRTRL